MSSTGPINPFELENRLASSRQMLDYLIAQLKLNRLDAPALVQRLTALQGTLTMLGDQRKEDRRNEGLARLYRVSRLIGSSLDLNVVLQTVMDAVIELTGAERGFVMLLENGDLTLKIGRNFDQQTLDQNDLTISHTIAHRVVDQGEPILTTNAQEDPRFAGKASVIINRLCSIMACPLRIRGRVIGLMYVDNQALRALFSPDELELLSLFGEQVAMAIDNAIQVEQREKALKAQIEALRIEIDEAKKQKQVAEIVETDEFKALAEKARRLRAERHARLQQAQEAKRE